MARSSPQQGGDHCSVNLVGRQWPGGRADSGSANGTAIRAIRRWASSGGANCNGPGRRSAGRSTLRNWIAVTQGKLKLGSTHETYFQDLML